MGRKYTIEEFIIRAKKTHGNKYDYSKVVYVGIYSIIIIICPTHSEFTQTPAAHLSGQGCPKCGGTQKLTTKEFINKSIKVHGNTYDYGRVIYINNRTEVTINCPIHGEFSQIPGVHMRGNGCPKCGGTVKLTTEEFIEKANKVHNNKYDYSKVVYISAKIDVIIICPFHGKFSQTPDAHINQKQGCPKCYKNNKYTTEEFIIRAIKVHRNIYDYSKVIYVNSQKEVEIICPIHGSFLQMPYSHLAGRGCSVCGGTKRHTAETFIIKANKVHNNYFDYSKVVYVNGTTEVDIGCPVPDHGFFSQRPCNHINGKQGCPICQASQGELSIAKILQDNKIEYIKQKKFSNCRNPKTKWKLMFDFFIPSLNMLIEFNGAQHYENVSYWHKNGNSFKEQQYRDSIKQQYALSHGYKFLVIKYNENVEKKLKKALSI